MRALRSKFIIIGLICFIAQAAMQQTYIHKTWADKYGPKGGSLLAGGLQPDQLLFALVGLREFIAGILWVRADSFFDTGNYDAILPIINLVTWLDPHQIDVYSTGMWHIAYNFTDEESRSDRRYIPSALALGKKGVKANPETYELFFETGWIWYHKIDDDYDNAVKWFKDAQTKKDMLTARKNLLSNALQRAGRIEEALDLYFELLDDAEKELSKDKAFKNHQNRDTIERNIDTLLVRMVQRGYLANKRNDGSYASGGYDTNPPFDVGFSARMSVERERVIKVEGTWNVQPVGTRIRIVLRDKNFKGGRPAAMDWDMADEVNVDRDRESTFMQDQLYVKNRRFSRTIDMSRDTTMYPCISPEYVVEFYYNPRSAPPHIQDRFGFSGEGFTDSNFLSTDARPNQRVMYTSLALTRDQILRRGEWLDRVPVIQTKNFKPISIGAPSNKDMIMVPGIRSNQTTVAPMGQGAAKEVQVKP